MKEETRCFSLPLLHSRSRSRYLYRYDGSLSAQALLIPPIFAENLTRPPSHGLAGWLFSSLISPLFW